LILRGHVVRSVKIGGGFLWLTRAVAMNELRLSSLGSKAFFSEEKKQKTSMSLSRISPEAYSTRTKVFWLFFSKKNCLPVVDGFHSYGFATTSSGNAWPKAEWQL
jgi:hypothetical protein